MSFTLSGVYFGFFWPGVSPPAQLHQAGQTEDTDQLSTPIHLFVRLSHAASPPGSAAISARDVLVRGSCSISALPAAGRVARGILIECFLFTRRTPL